MLQNREGITKAHNDFQLFSNFWELIGTNFQNKLLLIETRRPQRE